MFAEHKEHSRTFFHLFRVFERRVQNTDPEELTLRHTISNELFSFFSSIANAINLLENELDTEFKILKEKVEKLWQERQLLNSRLIEVKWLSKEASIESYSLDNLIDITERGRPDFVSLVADIDSIVTSYPVSEIPVLWPTELEEQVVICDERLQYFHKLLADGENLLSELNKEYSEQKQKLHAISSVFNELPECLDTYVRDEHLRRLQSLPESERLPVIQSAPRQATLSFVCRQFFNYWANQKDWVDYDNRLIIFFFAVLNLYPKEARQQYVDASLIRLAAVSFSQKEFSKLLAYYSGTITDLKKLLGISEDESENSLLDNVLWSINSRYEASTSYLVILKHYPLELRYTVLMKALQGCLSRVKDLDLLQEGVLAPIDKLKLQIDRQLFILEIANEESKDPSIHQLIQDVSDLKSQLFSKNFNERFTASQTIRARLIQTEASFEPQTLFGKVIHALLSLIAYVVSFCSEQFGQTIREVNKSKSQKIYEQCNLKFTLFGENSCGDAEPNYNLISQIENIMSK